MDDAITEDGSADRLFLLMLYTGARAMDGPDDRDVGRCGFGFFPRETWLRLYKFRAFACGLGAPPQTTFVRGT